MLKYFITVMLSMNCVIDEPCYRWTVLSMNCVIDELCYRWTLLSMNCIIDELCYRWIAFRNKLHSFNYINCNTKACSFFQNKRVQIPVPAKLHTHVFRNALHLFNYINCNNKTCPYSYPSKTQYQCLSKCVAFI